MDLMQIQEMFRATDAADGKRLCEYLHPDLVLRLVGVEGAEAPFDRPAYFRFLEESNADRRGRNERTEHIPTHVKIGRSVIAVRGFLKIEIPGEADQYHPFTDLLKLRDDQIVEYDIAYDI